MPFLTRCIIRFKEIRNLNDSQNSITLICEDGSIYSIAFDPVKGGEAAIISSWNILTIL
jgi:hypothetical protein